MGKLEGKVAIVTGAGRGIGREIARKLAKEGARLVVNDLDPDPAEQTAQAMRELGVEALAYPGDVAAPDFGVRIVAHALDRLGGLDIIVNNAGYIWNTTIQKATDAQWEAMLAVHATAPFRILRAAAEHFRAAAKREAAEGRRVMRKVVNVSSVSGTHGAATQASYGSAKAAQIGLTKALAQEWGRYNVTVNAVAFATIDTRLTRAWREGKAAISLHGRDLPVGLSAEQLAEISRLTPLGRPGTAEEAAGAVYLLCIPESDYITGHVLICSGGMYV
jgi:3-oxoacyl-[acyl-carrier protein] reductase